MWDQLLLVVVGFALTSVAGGFIGYKLQQRAWRQRERARTWDAERDAARAFFEDLSRLFDRRLHRMRQLDEALSEPGTPEEVARLRARYREAVDDWNDNLNRNLALAQRYFGLRNYLDYGLMRRFVEAGRLLRRRIAEFQADGHASTPLTGELDSLANEVYSLNVRMIEAIQRGNVGVFRDDLDHTTESS